MRKLRADDSPSLTAQCLRLLAIRLRSRPATSPLAKDVTAHRAAVRAAIDAYEEARDQRIAASGEVVYRDALVDRPVMDLARTLAVTTGGKQDDPRFRRLFPSAPSAALRPVGGEAQGRFVLGVLQGLKDDPAYKPFAAQAKLIREALTALDGAEDQRRDAYVAEARARAEELAVTAAAQRAYNALFHQVALKLPNDDALVESFFLSSAGTSSPADPPPAPADGEGAPATPAVKKKRTR